MNLTELLNDMPIWETYYTPWWVVALMAISKIIFTLGVIYVMYIIINKPHNKE